MKLNEELEAIIDREGLSAIVTELAAICWDKAEHIRTNWQDRELARTWQRAGDRLQVAFEYCPDKYGRVTP